MAKLLVALLLVSVYVANQVDAKPFISPNFFVLTTRAPANGSTSSSGSSSSTFNLNFGDIFSRKLRFITSLLQRGGSGGVSGTFGFGINKLGGRVSTTTTTTTTSPVEVETEYVPDSSEDSGQDSTTSRTTTTTSSVITTSRTPSSETTTPEVTVTSRNGGDDDDDDEGGSGNESNNSVITRKPTTGSGYQYTTPKPVTSSYVYAKPMSVDENEVTNESTINRRYLPAQRK